MEEGLVAVMVLFVLVGLPTLCLTGSWVITSLSRQYFALRKEELALRRWEGEARLEHARVTSGMPGWVDRSDPIEVAAWHRAVVEVYRISAQRSVSAD
jgi:hypothetical protein